MSGEKPNVKKISKKVVSMVAIQSATEVKGVHKVKDVKVFMEKGQLLVDLYLSVDYGVKIPQLAWDIQNSISQEITNLTHINIGHINIHISGVEIPEKGRDL